MFTAIGAFAGTWLLCYVLKLDDLFVLSIAAFFRVLSALVMIFGYQVWHIYFAKLLSCTLGISGSIIRSFLSRIVAKDELGNAPRSIFLISFSSICTNSNIFMYLNRQSIFTTSINGIDDSSVRFAAVYVSFQRNNVHIPRSCILLIGNFNIVHVDVSCVSGIHSRWISKINSNISIENFFIFSILVKMYVPDESARYSKRSQTITQNAPSINTIDWFTV